MSTSCRNTGCKTITPLFYGTVNQLLINLVPFIRDALVEFINTGNLASINPVLHDPPDLVIHRIQIWAIWRPQIWRNSQVSLVLTSWCFTCPVCWRAVLLKHEVIRRWLLDIWQQVPHQEWVTIVLPNNLDARVHKVKICTAQRWHTDWYHDGITEGRPCGQQALKCHIFLVNSSGHVHPVILCVAWGCDGKYFFHPWTIWSSPWKTDIASAGDSNVQVVFACWQLWTRMCDVSFGTAASDPS